MCYASETFSKKYVSRVPIHCVVLYRQKKVYFARDSVNPGWVVNSFYSCIMKHLCALTSALTIVARSSDDNFAYTLYIIQFTVNIILRPSTHLETDSKASHWNFGFPFCMLELVPPKQCQGWTSRIHSESEKVCGTTFSVKKIAEKVRKSGRHFWVILGNFVPFWVIFGPF